MRDYNYELPPVKYQKDHLSSAEENVPKIVDIADQVTVEKIVLNLLKPYRTNRQMPVSN